MHYTKVNINRDETTMLVVHVGAWEVPVLEAKHGEERLSVGELAEFKGRPWPENARSEMQRLNQLYGKTGAGDEAPTFAEKVYGSGSAGVKALEAAIRDARSKAEPVKKRASKGADLVGAASA
jgi:hypothetical protein